MRRRGRIFMGNGDSSLAHAYELHNDLSRAIGMINAWQQGAGDLDYETEILMIAEQIHEALTDVSLFRTRIAENQRRADEREELRRREANPTAKRLYEQYQLAMKLGENA